MIAKFFARFYPKRSMAYRLFVLISLLDQSITRDRAIVAAAEQRLARACQRKARAQRRLARRRAK